MAYDEQYYKSKKEELDKKFNKLKDQLIQDMINMINRFGEARQDLGQRFDEISKQEEESKKKAELDKPKKKEV